MFQLLVELEAPKDIIEILWKIYEHDQTRYRINNKIVLEAENQKGVKQGASSSPILFNLVIQKIIHEFIRNRRGQCIGREYVGILAFADDIAIIDNNLKEMQ